MQHCTRGRDGSEKPACAAASADKPEVKSSGVNSALSNFGTGANLGDTRPAAFLNYILFDQNYAVVDAGWQVVPAGSFTKQYLNMPTITVKEAGYIFVYLSYEDQSNNYVYFDDFKVTLTPTNIVQSNDYYPFGLQHSTSWTRDNATNNFLYDGGSELNTTTSLYDLPYRNYDPTLGRFFQVDPLAHIDHNLTPYHYSRNNPMGYSDPSGAEEDAEFIGAEDNNEWSVDQTTSSEGGGGGEGGNNGQITVHGIVDNGNGTYTVTVTGADGQGYTAVVNESGDVLNAVNNDAFDAGNTSNVSVSGTYFTNNGDGTGTGVSWSTGGGQFTMTATTGALDSNGGILAGSGSTFNSTSIDLSSVNSVNINNEGNSPDAFAVGQFMFDTGAATYSGYTLGLTNFRQANGAQIMNRFIGFGTQQQAKTLSRLGTFVGNGGKWLGAAGYVFQAGTLLYKSLNGEKISTADKVGFGISTALTGLGALATVVGGTVFAPAVAGAALVYGVAELGSFVYNGKSLEANILGR